MIGRGHANASCLHCTALVGTLRLNLFFKWVQLVVGHYIYCKRTVVRLVLLFGMVYFF